MCGQCMGMYSETVQCVQCVTVYSVTVYSVTVYSVTVYNVTVYSTYCDPPTTRDTGEDIEVKEVTPYLPSPTSSHMLHLMHRSHHMY